MKTTICQPYFFNYLFKVLTFAEEMQILLKSFLSSLFSSLTFQNKNSYQLQNFLFFLFKVLTFKFQRLNFLNQFIESLFKTLTFQKIPSLNGDLIADTYSIFSLFNIDTPRRPRIRMIESSKSKNFHT